MGNCHTTPTSAGGGSISSSRRGKRSGNNEQSRSSRSNNGRYHHHHRREESVHLVPGRIFSNEGKSSISSIFTQQGRKGINQDAMILWEDFGVDGGILCGIFDGHGPQGHLVARKVRDALPLKLLSFFPNPTVAVNTGCLTRRRTKHDNNHDEDDDEEKKNDKHQQPSISLWREAFLKSYKAMDKELRSHHTLDCFCSGSTAVTLLKLGSNLLIGNIGDSRAVLASKGDTGDSMVAVQLTVDLKPDLPREAERIKRCRGRVFALQDEPEVPRVWLPFDDAPGLAMARAFGDFCLKDYGVISVPEFSHWTLTDKDQFVVLASDGVWDVLSNKEVVDIISSSPTRSLAAKFLVDAATREWKLKYSTSKMDDCAVVCLYVDGKVDHESGAIENSTYAASCYNHESTADESRGEAQIQEPTLDRNYTVRSAVGRISAVEECRDTAVVEDQNWLGLEGVTRVNSLVQLPRFSGEKLTA